MIQKMWRVFAVVVRNGSPKAGFRGSSTISNQLYPARMGFAAGDDIGEIITPAHEVPLTEVILISSDASAKDVFSQGLIARLNSTGKMLFWRRLRGLLVPGRSRFDSTFYEALTTKSALDTVYQYGYRNHPKILVINDNQVTVNTINDPGRKRKPHVALVVQDIHASQKKFTTKPTVIHKLDPVQRSVDHLAKSGQPLQTKYPYKRFIEIVRKEEAAFPFKEGDFKTVIN